MMPWRLAYWPVMIEARLGEQSGVVWNADVNIAPSWPMRSMCGVFMKGWPQMPSSSNLRSSIRTTRKFGLRFFAMIGLLSTPRAETLYPPRLTPARGSRP